MRDEYDVMNLNPRKNPYSNRRKKQITLNLNIGTVDYFKDLSKDTGVPYQTLINLYLTDCAEHKRKLKMAWK